MHPVVGNDGKLVVDERNFIKCVANIARKKARKDQAHLKYAAMRIRGKGLTINPMSWRMQKWDGVLIFCLLYVCFVTPFEASFVEPPAGGGVHVSTLFLFNRFIDVVFLADMIIAFFTGT
jgi:hypothetical protein